MGPGRALRRRALLELASVHHGLHHGLNRSKATSPPQGGSPSGAVREGDYKLIEFFEDSRLELYNLANDIGEKHDLAAEMPDLAARLRKMLHDWRGAVDARMPRPNPDFKEPREAAK